MVLVKYVCVRDNWWMMSWPGEEVVINIGGVFSCFGRLKPFVWCHTLANPCPWLFVPAPSRLRSVIRQYRDVPSAAHNGGPTKSWHPPKWFTHINLRRPRLLPTTVLPMLSDSRLLLCRKKSNARKKTRAVSPVGCHSSTLCAARELNSNAITRS